MPLTWFLSFAAQAVGLAGCGNNLLGNQDLGWLPSRRAVIGTAFGIGGGVAAVTIAAHHTHHR